MNSAGDSKRIKVLHLIPSLSIGGAELDMVRKALVLARSCDFEIFILPYQGNWTIIGIVALCRRDYVRPSPPFERELRSCLRQVSRSAR